MTSSLASFVNGHAPHPVYFSSFPHHTVKEVDCEDELPWEKFVDLFREPNDQSTPKDALQLWSPARFEPTYQEDENVRDVSLLTFDVDEAPVPTADDMRRGLAGVRSMTHSSSRATAESPRWRSSLALSRPVTKDEFDRLWPIVASRLPFLVGQQSKNASRGWYGPRRGPDGFYEMFEIKGAPLDVDKLLAQAPVERTAGTGPSVTKVRASNAAFVKPEQLSSVYDAMIERIGNACFEACPENGNRHELSLLLSGALVSDSLNFQMPHEDVPALVSRICKHAGFGDLPQKWANATRTVAKKRSGEAIEGFPKLRERFPHVADAISLDWAKTLPAMSELAGQTAKAANDTQAKPARRFEIVGASDLATPVPRVDYVWRHFGITKGRPSLLAGYGGSGKTIIVQCFALHMAAGSGSCWGLPISSGPVLHIDYEMTLDPIKRRYQRLAKAYDIDLATCPLGVVSMSQIYLSDGDAEDALVEVCQGRTLCIIDNLAAATATSVSKENESGIRKYLDTLTRVSARTGCTFIVLVHERKASKDDPGGLQRVRGSSGITDASGSVVSISTAEGDGIVTASQTKTSHRKKGDSLNLKIEDTDEGGKPIIADDDEDAPGLRVVLVDERPIDEQTQKLEQEILTLLAGGPQPTKKAIETRIGGRKGRTGPLVDALLVKREIVFLKGKGFALDWPLAREQRVIETVQATTIPRTPAQLARTASVDTDVVEALIARRALMKDSSGRYFVT